MPSKSTKSTKGSSKKASTKSDSLVAPVYTQEGAQAGELALPGVVFGLTPDKGLIHRYLLLQRSNARIGTAAHTKEKGEVRGGGKKPWRQKGTGRARQGSTRNPQWKGGGVVFGPRNVRNFTVAMNKKERRKALFSCLSAKAQANKVLILDGYEPKEIKTRYFAKLLSKLPLEKDVLVVLPERNEAVERSARNIPIVKSILVQYLNPGDLLKYHHVLFLKEAIKKLTDVFTPGK